MFGLSLGHILILSIIVLLFGSRRLPELGHAMGKGVSAFKRGLEGKDANFSAAESEAEDHKLPPQA